MKIIFRFKYLIDCLAICLVFPAAAATFTTDTTITFYNTNYDGLDIILTNCTVTIDGLHSFASVHVLNQGKLTHTAAQNGFLINSIPVTNETHVLNGTNAVALNSTNILQYTIVVASSSGLITYSNGVDYTIAEDTNLITTIQRTDTSPIPDGATVNVSYSFQPLFDVPSGLNLAVAGDVQVEAGGLINVAGQGYGSNAGPGAGGATLSFGGLGTGAGGGHGGYGGLSASNAPGGGVFDVTSQPADKGGSGGSSDMGVGGSGGGAVKIVAGGVIRIDGTVIANGANATSVRSGGGAGGSIWLSGQTITGSGSIVADGGTGDPLLGGGGGGGRIALYYGNNSFSGILSTHGGNGWVTGGAGTIYRKDNHQPAAEVLVDNSGRPGTNTLLLATEPFNLTIASRAIVSLTSTQTIGNLLVTSNGALRMVSSWLIVQDNATVQSGGAIFADGTGMLPASGIGFGHSFSTGGSVSGGGAGYGGSGANALSTSSDGTMFAQGGTTYGSVSQPTDLGSGGGNGTGLPPFSLGGAGGGSVMVTVAGTLTVNGRISANGGAGIGEGSGGGSGGSVWLTVDALAGSGTISANGGAGNGVGGGGGGGRIAIYYQSRPFIGALQALGGSAPHPGGAGTIYSRDTSKPVGDVLVDNGGQSGAATTLATPEAFNLVGQGGALLSMPANFNGRLGSFVLASNAFILSSNASLVVTGNATIQAGAGYISDGLGFASGTGPGLGGRIFYSIPSLNGIYLGGGGGHGGFGANTISGTGGGLTYDNVTFPDAAGGSGGAGSDFFPTNSGGAGGGVIRLTVNGILQVDGRISSDGITPSGRNSGGGAGGSIQLAASSLSGSGIISANAGSGNGLGGGGGGGRIAVNYSSSSFAGAFRAWGGGTTTNIGGAGTIYLKASNQPTAQLIVDNGGRQGANSDLGIVSSISAVTIRGGGAVGNINQGGPTSLTALTSLFIGSNSFLFLANSGITVSNNVTVQAAGGIVGDGLGFPGGLGPGAGRRALDQTIGGGGGYGGYGGAGGGNQAFGGVGNGTFVQPTAQGSGGGIGNGNAPTNAGGAGGGSIRLTINGSLNVNGRISVNGVSGLSPNSGGGSGGSLMITAANLTGSGTISANGGVGIAQGGGGGGGHIVLQPTINQFLGTVSAVGGAGFNRGGAGTIYTKPSGQQIGLLLVDNGGNLGTNTYVNDGGSYDLTVTGGGVVAHSTPSFSPRTLLLLSNGWVSVVNQLLSVSGNATIQAGGGIIANGTASTSGQGAGNSYVLNGGGGYGGAGGANLSSWGRTYGSLQFPIDMGSKGANASQSTVGPFGSAGGGAIHMTVTGILAVDGSVSANGGNGDLNSGGGSGGSVWMSAGTLIGAGSISANGGSGNGNGGGGGGGRIAITFNTNLFSGSFSALGGNGIARGGAGTIYIKANNQSIATVILDNAGQNGTNSGLGTFSGTIDVTLNSGTLLSSAGLGTIRNLLINSNAWLIVSNSSTPLNFQGDVNILSGGGILADGTGFSGAAGNGAGGTLSSTSYGVTGGGGGHGGLGAPSAAGAFGGQAYDSPVIPILAGSGGGTGASGTASAFGGSGGGAILLNVTGSLVVQGKISANGLPGNGFGSGGGGGGSIALTLKTLSGAGVISANGGAGNGYGGGGGGGCIAINHQTNSFNGTITAVGGSGWTYGGAGTVFSARSGGMGLLSLDNGGHFGAHTPLAPGAVMDLLVASGAIAHSSSGYLILSNLTVSDNGALASLQQSNLDLSVLGDASVAATGLISTDGKGYPQDSGPGAGLTTNHIGSGAGYGGIGGASTLLAGGNSYGSAQQPVDEGSGGGSGYPGFAVSGGGSEGGGAIRLAVARTLTLNGRLSANGNSAFQEDGGGGAGGSVWVLANTIDGNGVMSADGGAGELFQGGGGGGGRIAVYARTNFFAGQTSAFGGVGFGPAQDGSIYSSTNFPALTVLGQNPAGMVTNGVDFVDFVFSDIINPNSISPNDISIVTPIGPVPQTDILTSLAGASTLRVRFPLQTSPGNYSITVGPQVEDLFLQPMSQAFQGSFTISVPIIQGTITDTNGQPVSGIVVQPDLGSAATTDLNGQYAIGVPPGSSVTIMPLSSSWMFAPGSRSYGGVTGSISNQNFVAVVTIAPVLTSQLQGGGILLSWTGLSGVNYQTFFSSDLVTWVPSSFLPGTTGPMSIFFFNDNFPTRFFRLRASN